MPRGPSPLYQRPVGHPLCHWDPPLYTKDLLVQSPGGHPLCHGDPPLFVASYEQHGDIKDLFYYIKTYSDPGCIAKYLRR